MATYTGNLAPDAILESTGFSSGVAVTNIQDDPASPDANWIVTTTNGNSVLRVSFPTPSPQPVTLDTTSQVQLFNVRVRATGTTTAGQTIQIQLYKNGTMISQDITRQVSNAIGQTLSYTWTAPSGDDGSQIECRIIVTGVSSGSKKGSVDIGAVQWAFKSIDVVADTTPPANVTNLAQTHTDTTVNLTWTNPADVDFSKANVYRNNTLIGNSTNGTYADSGLTQSTAYTYKVTSVDTTNNESTGSTINVTTSASIPPTTAPNVPANLFPFNGSAWTKLHFEADITDIDSTNLTFYVDYSTNSTLSSGVTTLSQNITLPSAGSIVRGSITSASSVTESTVYYWRAYVKDDSNVTSSYSPIFSFTIKNASGDNMVPDGTQFMQQGNPNYHGVIIDVNSANDTAVNFTTMLSQGVKGAYLRAYGHDHTAIDANFVSWASSAKTAGMPTGAYFYAMPSSPTLSLSDADTQAELFANALQQAYGTGQYGDLVPMLDLEDNSGYVTAGQATTNMTVSDLLTWSNEFRNHFESITGRTLGVYVDNYFVFNTMGNFNYDSVNKTAKAGTSGNILHDMPLWVAGDDSYPRYMGSVMPECGGWLKWYAFQHTSKATASTYGVTAGNSQIDASWCEPIEYLEPPKATTGLVGSDNGTNITLTWNHTTEVDVHEWDIYVDGSKIGTTSTDGSYVITSPTKGVAHTIEVRPIDDFGDDPITTPTTISYTIAGSGGGTAPVVTINNVTHYTVSDESGFTSTDITFIFDKDVNTWTVNVNGASYDTGTVASSGSGGSGGSPTTVATASTWTVSVMSSKTVSSLTSGGVTSIIAGTQIIATVDWTELYQEGQNKVNIYGQGTDGTWTIYQS